MQNSLLFIFIHLLYLYVPIKYSAMIYQQNHYHLDRYAHWLHTNQKQRKPMQILVMLCGSYLAFFLPNNFCEEGVCLLILIISYFAYKLDSKKRYRVPLRLTYRMKRFLLVQVCGLSIVLYMYQYLPLVARIWCTPFLFFLPFLFVNASSVIVEPMEQTIQEHYLQEAKKLLRSQKELLIVGITGSYGKTSVKNMLYTLLSEEFTTLMTPKSYNNKMGITLTIRQSLKPVHELFLCEMGADHVGEITEMMQFVKPEIGIVTAIGPQHLQTFKSQENIIHEKMQMIECLPSHGIGILNADNEYIRSFPLRTQCQILWFGKDAIADYQLKDVEMHGSGTSFHIVHQGEEIAFHTNLLGEHNAYNLCCSIALAHRLGVSFPRIQQLVERVPFVKHRLQIVSTSPYTLIDDAYNANPVGAKNALDVLQAMKERTIIVTPGMIDLGEKEDEENYIFGKHMAHCVDYVILVGSITTRYIKKGLIEEAYPQEHLQVCESFHEAMQSLSHIVQENDVVLLENDLPDAFSH